MAKIIQSFSSACKIRAANCYNTRIDGYTGYLQIVATSEGYTVVAPVLLSTMVLTFMMHISPLAIAN